MNGLYQETQYKRWLTKGSIGKRILSVYKTQGFGMPDFCVFVKPPYTGFFVEVKYRYKGSSIPIYSLLSKEQKQFFACFKDVFLAYRTRYQGWSMYKLTKHLKFVLITMEEL